VFAGLRARQEAPPALRPRHPPPAGADARQRSPPLELAFSLLFTLPGTPMLQYGDEIGIGDDLTLPERECARTPMQWYAESTAASRPRAAGAAGDLRSRSTATSASTSKHSAATAVAGQLGRAEDQDAEGVPEISWGDWRSSTRAPQACW
jgi:maltose alpha-D-glucosyltransferase/alpha-amylase